MRHSTLLKNIAPLSTKDRNQFQKWLISPIFNQRDDLPKLFQYIHQCLDKRPEWLFKEKVWPVMYPDTPYQEAKMNLVMSLLLQQLRDFLAWQAWQDDRPAPQLYLCMRRTMRNRLAKRRLTLPTNNGNRRGKT